MAAQARSNPTTHHIPLEVKRTPSDSFLGSISDTFVKKGHTFIRKRKSISFAIIPKSTHQARRNSRRWNSLFKQREDIQQTSVFHFHKHRKEPNKPSSPAKSDEDSCSSGTTSDTLTYHHPLEGNPSLRMTDTDDFITVEYPPPLSGTISPAAMRACLRTPSSPGAALALHHGVHHEGEGQESEKRPSLQFEGRRWRCDNNGWWVEPATPKPQVTKIPGAYSSSDLTNFASYFDLVGSTQHEKSPVVGTMTLEQPQPPQAEENPTAKPVEPARPPSPSKSPVPFESDRFAIITPTARVVHRYIVPPRRPPTPPGSPPPPRDLSKLHVHKQRMNHSALPPSKPNARREPAGLSAAPSTVATGDALKCHTFQKKPTEASNRISIASTLVGRGPPTLPPLFKIPSLKQILRWMGYLYIVVCILYALDELRDTITFAAWPLRIIWKLVKAMMRE